MFTIDERFDRTLGRTLEQIKKENRFYLNDKVRLFGKVVFISGFTTGGCYVKDIHGDYVTIPDKAYKQIGFKHLEFICHNNNWQMPKDYKAHNSSLRL